MPSYLLGVLLLAAMVVPPAWAAGRIRHRLLPEWSGAAGLVVDVVLWTAQVVVVPEVLGAFGLFHRFVVALSLLAAGVAAGCVAGRPPARRPEGGAAGAGAQSMDGRAVPVAGAPLRPGGGVAVATRPEELDDIAAPVRPAIPGAETLVSAGICALFAFPWVAWIWAALRSGIYGYDSLAYHLPFAAQWVQTGSLWRIDRLSPGTVVPYHPASAEIVHALGMLAFHSVLISPLVNLLWLALLGAAAWSIGSEHGRGPQCLALAVVAADCPMLLFSQPGSGMNDLTVIALATAAVAICVRARPLRRAAVPAGLALGLVAGSKLDGLAFVAVMFVGVVVVTPAAARIVVGGRMLLAGLVSGGFFYMRNLAAVGTPVPGLHVPVLPTVTAPLDALLGASVAHYLGEPSFVHRYLIPNLRFDFGTLWPVWVVVAVGGALAALASGPTPTHRVAALAALATTAAWVVTPTSAAGPPGNPTLLGYNIRYASAGLVLGAVLLPVVPKLASRAWGWMLLAIALVLAGTSLTPAASWPGSANYSSAHGWKTLSVLVVVPLGALVAGAGVAAWRLPRSRRPLIAAASGAAVVALLLGTYWLRSNRLPGYYRSHPLPIAADVGAMAVLHHERLGTVGAQTTFPFYGADLSNRVEAIGVLLSHHDYSAPATCAQLRQAIDAGRYHYVLLAPDAVGQPLPPSDAWLHGAAGAVAVWRVGPTAVYRIDRPLDPAGCPD